MGDWLSRHRLSFSAFVLLVLPLGIMWSQSRETPSPPAMQSLGMQVAGTSQAGISSVVGGMTGVFDHYVFLWGVREENERLRAENEKLLAEAIAAKKVLVENESLRKLLGFGERYPTMQHLPATVVGRDLTPFYRVQRIVLQTEGTQAEVDMAVVTDLGLLGRIVKVAGRFADVMLLSDSRSRVACEALGQGIPGILAGTGQLEAYGVRWQVSTTDAPLEDGTPIVTSGHDRVFPRGLEVGYVTNAARRRQVGAFIEYEVALAVNPAQVHEVLIVASAAAAKGR